MGIHDLIVCISCDTIDFEKKLSIAGDFLFSFKKYGYSMNQMQEKNMFVKVKRSSAGLGLFAVVPIKKGKTIIEYIGERIPTSEGDKRDNRYIFNVSSRIDIDGSPRYNTARYINHSCRPNCEAINRRGRVFIVAKKHILAEEELHYNYGKSYFESLIAVYGCLCTKCLV